MTSPTPSLARRQRLCSTFVAPASAASTVAPAAPATFLTPAARATLLLPAAAFALVSLAAFPATAAAQAGLGFLRNGPANSFNQDDVGLMYQNVNAVLDSASPNARREWSNPKTGNSGYAEVKGQFIATDNALCKRFRIFNKTKQNVEGEGTYTSCKYEGRGWLLNPDAKPAASGPK